MNTLKKLFVGGVFLSSSIAMAFQTAKVGPSGAPMRAQPKADAKIVETLKASTNVSLSDQPTSGFYRVRSSSGKSGWVSQSDVVLASAASTQTYPPSSTSSPGNSIGYLSNAQYQVGLNLGLGIFSGTSAFTFGVTGDYKFTPNIMGGLYFDYASLGGVSTTTGSSSSHILVFALEGNYYFDHTGEGFYAGAKVGIANAGGSATFTDPVSGATASVSSSGTGFLIGPAGGYLYPIQSVQGLTIAGEFNVLIVTGSNSGTNVNFLVGAKYAF